MFDENSPEFGEGEKAGLTIDGSACACPYLPGSDEGMKKRLNWMAGFSRSRDQVGPFSEDADRRRVTNTPHRA